MIGQGVLVIFLVCTWLLGNYSDEFTEQILSTLVRELLNIFQQNSMVK